MFDDAVKSILDESKAVEESIIAYKPAHTQAEQSVIRFLDIYFVCILRLFFTVN